MKSKFIYQCVDCKKEYTPGKATYLCPGCQTSNHGNMPPKGVLKVVYDYEKIKHEVHDLVTLRLNGYLDVLPFDDIQSLPKLHIGNTPLYCIDELEDKKLPFKVFLKDDSQNPTFSFKDRASAVVSACAKEVGHKTIVTASTGNAGSSLAGICAAQGQKAVIMVPAKAPIAKLTQIVMYGATIVPVKGTYDDAFDLSMEATQKFGWYNRNTAFNPMTIEGKKTVSFELLQQLNNEIPSRVFVPVGDGVIISGVYKGFEDLLNLGMIERMPIVVAVQSKGSDNIVRNVPNTNFESKLSKTIADSISVDVPRNYHMAKHFLEKYNGELLTISDEEILNASAILSRNTGLFAEPAAAAAFAGMLAYEENNKLENDSKNVVLLTGSGLKDLEAVSKMIRIPEAIDPSISNLEKLLS